MAEDLFENMKSLYEKASKGKLYPDAMIAAESWFRFRMGDEAFDEVFRSGRARYVDMEEGTQSEHHSNNGRELDIRSNT